MRNIKKEVQKIENKLYYLNIIKELIILKNISELKSEYDLIIKNITTWYKLSQK